MAFARTAVSITGTLTNGSASITGVSSTTLLYVGLCIYGTGIQADTIITGISGTTVTMSRNATASGTPTITGQYISQTGTDTNPTGLTGLTGVTTITEGTGDRVRTIYNLGLNQLRIQGTFTHDPDLYEIIVNVQYGMQTEAGCVYNYGIARTVNGQVTYSKGTGLVSTYNGGQFTNFGILFGGGTFNWNGGVLKTWGAIQHSNATVISNSYDSVWQMWQTGDAQWRATGTPTFNQITMQGVGANILLFLNSGWNALGIKFERCIYQTPAGGGANRTIVNPVFTGNQATTDILTNQAAGTQQIVTTKNPDRLPVLGKLSANAYGDLPTVETLSLSISDSTNTAVGASEAIAYIKDSNNGARLNSTVTNYVNDRAYIASSATGGTISMGDILVMVGVNPNLTNNLINYDYRSNFGNGSVDFNIYIGGYLYNPAVTRQSLIGNNGVNVKWTMFDDLNVSLSRTNALAKLASNFTVNPTTKTITVTANSTYDDLYDIAKAWKYNGTQLNAETPTISDLILKANGSNLEAYTGWNLVVNNAVTLSSGTKFNYIKFTNVTINGTGQITAVYQTSAGTSTVLQISVPSDGYSVCLYRNGITKYFGNNLTTGNYNVYLSPAEANTYTIAAESYGQKRTEDTLDLDGGSFIFNITDTEDVGITATKATASAYTTLTTTEQIYDATAIFRLTETGIKLGQLVARDGLYLDFGTYNVKLKDDASAIVGVATGTITYKSIVINEATKYNAMKATPPATITPTDTEIINVLIEDANGNSQLSILGGDNLGYELWKVTTATATDDYATGTLLDTLATNDEVFRFIGISGYDIVGRDVSSGVRRRTSMVKGTYEQAFYVGNQIQLATDAPQLIDTNNKIDELILKVDTNLDVAVSTRLADADYIDPATAQDVWEYATRTLTSAGASGATLAEIEASTILAMKADIQAVSDKVDTKPTLAEMVSGDSNLAKQDLLIEVNSVVGSTDFTLNQMAGTDFDPMNDSLDAISAKVDTLQTSVDNIDVDLTPVLNAVDLTLKAADYVAPDNTTIAQIKTKVDTLQNTDLTPVLTAVDLTLKENDYIAPDNASISAIKAKTDELNTERLKQVATVETTGEQIKAFNI